MNRSWIFACAAGELIGIAAAALWWVSFDHLDPEPATLSARLAMLGAKAASGLVEGALLGWLQWRVLVTRYPHLSASAWIGATAALAVTGWAIGSSFAIFAPSGPAAPPPELSAAATIALAAAFGLAVGLLFGAAQWLALRHAATRALLWIPANALGWAVALPCIYLAASIDIGLGLVGIAALGITGGCAAGLLLGIVTGAALPHMPAKITSGS